jgi:hypothetical protein
MLGLRSQPPAMPAEAEREPSENIKTTHPVRFVRGDDEPAMPRPLPAAEIARTLWRFRCDPEFRGERRVPLRTLAAHVELSHETLYQALNYRTMSERTRVKLSFAITAILERRLCFRRSGRRWELEWKA